ncbi:MAG: universal stress protein [Candidatus Acidiferrales bacterium]|jgi:nucleotide-binding universal stress UspA family protein
MTDPGRAFAIRRILVALDASSHSMAALAAAAELAARLEAELMGIFVEDVALLRLADSPYAREILYPSATEAPLSRASMEAKLRAQSERARKAMEAAAEHSQVQWSFRAVRGEVTQEVLAAAGGADLLAMGKVGWSFGGEARMGSTAREAATSATPVLLLPEGGLPPDARVLVHYDGLPDGKRRLLAAAQLVRPGTGGITILLAATNPDRNVVLQNEVRALLEGTNIDVRYRQIDPQDEMSLLGALKAEKPGIFVVGGRGVFKTPQSLEKFLREAESALLLLGDGSESEAE